ncbi:diguanylate cyclase [Metabacillus litoralis]|uniref:Diguanylate cyclase n=1 Tax=Metabacillus litoralis TaxID=152268 RepID=A0A5C6W1W4_9BACI|nr:diguanylate cyclase [Metabacillus litoralis]TXC91275.1 diguanylate cyclase [Metabacillus litoralis]
MNKYLQTLVKNVRKQLESWLNEHQIIQHSELYRFLHSISGTASTIGFTVAGEMAQKLMDQLKEFEEKEWTKEELQSFLFPLISIFYYEEFSNLDEVIEKQAEIEDQKLILIIDDDTALLMYLKDQLEMNGWVVIAVADSERAINSYYDLNPDCVIIDIHMKDRNGLDVLLQLKDQMNQQFIPTIMISVDKTKEMRMKSYKLGADDYIEKPLEMDEFIVRINRQLERKQAIDDLMLIDELTRVYNRKYLSQTYERLISHLKRQYETFSIAMLDLDHFKQINDSYGHVVGDNVLATFAEIIRNELRLNDIVIRYGGEEFMVLLPDTKAKEAKVVLDRVLKEFSNHSFTSNQGEQFSCTFSGGIHEIQLDQLDMKKNIEMADSALYEAKVAGRAQMKLVPVNNVNYHKKPIHIGIIDDDPIIRTMLEDLINKSKYTEAFTLDIRCFKDGMEFFESSWHEQNNEPYLIILDGMMPRMDGLEVLQRLRESRFQERITVMMLTSRKSEQDISRALQLGADDYITKPFKLMELETRLGHLIKRMK